MKTIYTKPLRMPDSMPTRISDVLTLTEDDGKITKIERTVGGKTEEINTGLPELQCTEYTDDFNGAWRVDPESLSTNGYSIMRTWKIPQEIVNKLFKFGTEIDEELASMAFTNIVFKGLKELAIEYVKAHFSQCPEEILNLIGEYIVNCGVIRSDYDTIENNILPQITRQFSGWGFSLPKSVLNCSKGLDILDSAITKEQKLYLNHLYLFLAPILLLGISRINGTEIEMYLAPLIHVD